MKVRLGDPRTWRVISSIALVVAVASLLKSGPIPAWGWVALIVSGVAFGVEIALGVRNRRGGHPGA